MAGEVWDWPNQQVVRGAGSGPGVDTPNPGYFITYGHAGLAYEFLAVRDDAAPIVESVDWEFGDGATATVAGATPATHTYAAAGPVVVRASRSGRQAVLGVTVEALGDASLDPEPDRGPA